MKHTEQEIKELNAEELKQVAAGATIGIEKCPYCGCEDICAKNMRYDTSLL